MANWRVKLPCGPLFAVLAAVSLSTPALTQHYLEWDTVPGRNVQPVCITIPQNMSLCRDIGYTRMKLPNLLEHDSLSEISQQAASWVPLLNLRCDPDAQLFLCSLFAPICLERPIYPCRSLCQKVERSCGARMQQYGYPWPDMVRCDKFPADNDMCIKAQSDKQPSEKVARWEDDGGPLVIQEPPSESCNACNQPETKENMLDHFCRSDVAVRTKFRRIRSNQLLSSKAKLFKPHKPSRAERRQLRRPTFHWAHDVTCCPEVKAKTTKYLVMAKRVDGKLVPTFIMPWKSSPVFREVRRLLRKLDCSDPRAIQDAMLPATAAVRGPPQRRRGISGGSRAARRGRLGARGGSRRRTRGRDGSRGRRRLRNRSRQQSRRNDRRRKVNRRRKPTGQAAATSTERPQSGQ